MNIFRKIRVKNAPDPKGWSGRYTLKAMNKSHSNVTDWGLSFLDINENDNILDIGCGGGKTIQKLTLKTKGTVYGIDISATSIKEASRTNNKEIKNNRVILHKGTVSKMPFDNESFDKITAVETYFFWPDPINDLRECLRTLKTRGIIVFVFEERSDGTETDKQLEIEKLIPIRRISADSMARELKEAGFCHIRAEILNNHLCVIAEKPQQ